MQILRDGKKYELTETELFQAYKEQEHVYDKETILDEIRWYDDVIFKEYGLSRKQAYEFVDDMAYEYRLNMDKYGMDYEHAVPDAIKTILYKEKKI